MKNRPGQIVFLSILLLGLLIKGGYLFLAYPDAGSVSALSIDESYHYRWANLIASGDLFAGAPYFRAPFYAWFLAVLIKIFNGAIVPIRLIQLLLGVVTLGLIFRLGKKIADWRASAVASVLYALYPTTTYFEGQLLLDSLFTLLALWTFDLYLDFRAGRGRGWLFGAALGLTTITRPTILIFLPFLFIPTFSRTSPFSFSGRMKRTAIWMTAAGLIVFPVTAINYAFSDQVVLVSYQGGVNFYLGNNPDADGYSSTFPGIGSDWSLKDIDYQADIETGHQLRFNRQSQFWYEKGLNFFYEYPGKALALTAEKSCLLLSSREISNNRPLDLAIFANPLLSYLPVRFWLLLGLSILPLFLLSGRRRDLLNLYFAIAVYAVSVIMFFVSARFRLPLVPVIAVLGGIGIIGLVDEFKSGTRCPYVRIGLIAAAAVMLLSAANLSRGGRFDPRQALYMRGNSALRDGDYAAAIARFDSLLALDPKYELARVNRGVTYLKLGDASMAKQDFYEELSVMTRSADAANNLAAVYLLENQPDSVVYFAEKALEWKPYQKETPIIFFRLARQLVSDSKIPFVETHRQRFRIYHLDDPRYLFEEALYFSSLKRYQEAINNHLSALDLIDHHPAAIGFEIPLFDVYPAYKSLKGLICYQLGYLYGLNRQYQQSILYSIAALAADSDIREAYINLISGYRMAGDNYRADSVGSEFLRRFPDLPIPARP